MSPLSPESLGDCLWALANLALSLSLETQLTTSQKSHFSKMFLHHAAFSKVNSLLMHNNLLEIQVPVISLVSSMAKVSPNNVDFLVSQKII